MDVADRRAMFQRQDNPRSWTSLLNRFGHALPVCGVINIMMEGCAPETIELSQEKTISDLLHLAEVVFDVPISPYHALQIVKKKETVVLQRETLISTLKEVLHI